MGKLGGFVFAAPKPPGTPPVRSEFVEAAETRGWEEHAIIAPRKGSPVSCGFPADFLSSPPLRFPGRLYCSRPRCSLPIIGTTLQVNLRRKFSPALPQNVPLPCRFAIFHPWAMMTYRKSGASYGPRCGD